MSQSILDEIVENIRILPGRRREESHITQHAFDEVEMGFGSDAGSVHKLSGAPAQRLSTTASGEDLFPRFSVKITPALTAVLEQMIYPVDPGAPASKNYFLDISLSRGAMIMKYQSILGSRRVCSFDEEQKQRLVNHCAQLIAQREGMPWPPQVPPPHPDHVEAEPKDRNAERQATFDHQLHEEIASLIIAGNIVKLPLQQLNRYAEIKAILQNGGGKYNKGSYFVFRDEATARATIEAALGGKSINLKKDYQFFRTPKAAGEAAMRELGDIRGLRVLEPQAGDGALADLARDAGAAKVATVEIWDVNVQALRAKGYAPIEADFLELTPQDLGLFDAVIMNPPFTKGQDIAHVKHAMRFITPKGKLTAIISNSHQHHGAKKYEAFRNLMDFADANSTPLESGAFNESGTTVPTTIVTFDMEHLIKRFIDTGRDPAEFDIALEPQIEEYRENHLGGWRMR